MFIQVCKLIDPLLGIEYSLINSLYFPWNMRTVRYLYLSTSMGFHVTTVNSLALNNACPDFDKATVNDVGKCVTLFS